MRVMWRIVAGLVFGLAVVGSFNLALWVADREPPVEYEHAIALASQVPQGGAIEIEYSVFRKRICDVTAKRWLTDAMGERHSIPQYTVGLQLLAGRETYRRAISIPSIAAPGPARYEVSLDYICNPLQQIIGPIRVVSPPIRFEILKSTDGEVPANHSDG